MPPYSTIARRLRMLMRGARVDRELDEEMRLHVQLRQQRLQDQGLSEKPLLITGGQEVKRRPIPTAGLQIPPMPESLRRCRFCQPHDHLAPEFAGNRAAQFMLLQGAWFALTTRSKR